MDVPQHLRDLAVSDTGFVFDPYSGATFSVNASGLTILRALQRGAERDDILHDLMENFAVEGDDLHRDVDEFVQLMRHYGVLPKEFAL